MKTRLLIGLGVTALVLSMLGMDEVLLLFGAGVLAGLVRWAMPPADTPRPAAYGVLGLVLVAAAPRPPAAQRIPVARPTGAGTSR